MDLTGIRDIDNIIYDYKYQLIKYDLINEIKNCIIYELEDDNSNSCIYIFENKCNEEGDQSEKKSYFY